MTELILKDGDHYKDLPNQIVWQRCITFLDIDFCASFKVSYPIPGVSFCGSIAGSELCLSILGDGCVKIGEGLAIGLCIDDFEMDDTHAEFHFAIQVCVGAEIPFDGSFDYCEEAWSGWLNVPFLSDVIRQDIANLPGHEKLAHRKAMGALAKRYSTICSNK